MRPLFRSRGPARATGRRGTRVTNPEKPEAWRERLEQHLLDNGLRMTRQRLIIAEAFFGASGHPNIDELYEQVKAEDPSVGQATVYRTLKLLVDSGLANQSHFGDGTTRYESSHREHHDHLICDDCGVIVEFRNETIERLQDRIAEEHGFTVLEHEMVIHGRCNDADCPRRPSRRP
ncbi:MAG: transcriptional repressor [Deltaproteobacteria bacterium]|nr:transcriptional repressor [Deltaproteobacteria bacterium]